jgi:hypothetical protein
MVKRMACRSGNKVGPEDRLMVLLSGITEPMRRLEFVYLGKAGKATITLAQALRFPRIKFLWPFLLEETSLGPSRLNLRFSRGSHAVEELS